MNSYELPPWVKFWLSKYVEYFLDESLLDGCSDDEIQDIYADIGKMFLNMLYYYEYHYVGVPEELPISDRAVRLAFSVIKRDMEQSFADYEAVCDRNRESGKKGGRPPKNKGQNTDNGSPQEGEKPLPTNPPNPSPIDNEQYDYLGFHGGSEFADRMRYGGF